MSIKSKIPAEFSPDLYSRQISKISSLSIFGYNIAGTSTITDLTSIGAVATVTSVVTTKISSGSASDTAAGTGARTVQVTGLDVTGAEISEIATLSGQTGVTLTGSYLAVNDVQVLTAGSGGKNAGIIYVGSGTVTTGVPAVIISGIAVGDNKSLAAKYTVPLGNRLAIQNLNYTVSDIDATLGTEKLTTLTLVTRDAINGGLSSTLGIFPMESGMAEIDFPDDQPLVLGQGIELLARLTGTTAAKAGVVINGTLTNISVVG